MQKLSALKRGAERKAARRHALRGDAGSVKQLHGCLRRRAIGASALELLQTRQPLRRAQGAHKPCGGARVCHRHVSKPRCKWGRQPPRRTGDNDTVVDSDGGEARRCRRLVGAVGERRHCVHVGNGNGSPGRARARARGWLRLAAGGRWHGVRPDVRAASGRLDGRRRRADAALLTRAVWAMPGGCRLATGLRGLLVLQGGGQGHGKHFFLRHLVVFAPVLAVGPSSGQPSLRVPAVLGGLPGCPARRSTAVPVVAGLRARVRLAGGTFLAA
mmetsp:Transcript_7900/g.31216  ORF Transcript_7900/g.31216 Transcript_7900/m.31216 type:complete len:272 (-) Transcript_7900:3705-4520(-)